MPLDALILSRLQFAFTVSYHILFPTLTIGLALFLVIFEGLWLRTGNPVYRRHCHFWSKIFALTFGMGVVSGIVLSYEFGTNFSRFSEATGNVIGPLMTYEVLAAFFLEAGFLGVMLFGWNRVKPGFHYAATILVFLGTLASAFWIISANSWMHTPAGASLVDGIFHPESWWEIVFNPSFPYRFTHMVLASLLTASFFVAGVSAWLLLGRECHDFARRSLTAGILTAAVLIPVQITVGDLHGLNTLKHQPMKVAAMEGVWETRANVPLLLFAWPDQEAGTNRLEVGIPGGASFILEHDADAVVQGLDQVPAADRPNVPVVFFSFRVMVGVGILMLAVSWWGVWLMLRRRLAVSPRFLRTAVVMAPAGFVATLAGWWVTEVGRQPWVVQGFLRTADAASPISAGQVAMSLIAFVVVYGVLFAAYLYYLFKLIRKGPEAPLPEESIGSHAPARPAFMSATGEDD